MDSNATNGIPEGLATCESPVCDVRFEQTGMKIKPKRFCCDGCKMDAWVIKRAAKLFGPLSDERALEVLRAA
jgi:hypothetical protein